MRARVRTFEYDVALDRAGRLHGKDEAMLELEEAWTPEHLVLAALIRCTLTSLRYHAARAGIDDLAGSGTAYGRVTKRDEDERYAFVELACELEIEFHTAPPLEALRELLAKAERDCFVGASLTAAPTYRWRVDGEEVRTAA